MLHDSHVTKHGGIFELREAGELKLLCLLFFLIDKRISWQESSEKTCLYCVCLDDVNRQVESEVMASEMYMSEGMGISVFY